MYSQLTVVTETNKIINIDRNALDKLLLADESFQMECHIQLLYLQPGLGLTKTALCLKLPPVQQLFLFFIAEVNSFLSLATSPLVPVRSTLYEEVLAQSGNIRVCVDCCIPAADQGSLIGQ